MNFTLDYGLYLDYGSEILFVWFTFTTIKHLYDLTMKIQITFLKNKKHVITVYEKGFALPQ